MPPRHRACGFVALGVVSAGVLAAILAVALRRNGNVEVEAPDLEEFADELEAELGTTVSEPGFAE